MKRIVCALLFAAAFLGSAAADNSAALLKKADDHTNFPDTDFSAEYTISQEKPGEGSTVTKAVTFRRDRKEQFLVLIVEPVEDKGKGYLMMEGGIWLYDPRDRRFTFTSAQDAFRNTNARNSDFALSRLAAQYEVKSSSKEKLGIYNCYKLELAAKTREAPFPKKTIWISEDNAIRMFKDYSLSGQLLRTVAYQYQTLKGRDVPAKIIIVDELKKKLIDGKERKETTVITVAKPSFDELPASLFTKEYLERSGK
jgi:outer membrane lipoprotein-sorting protein